MKRNMKRISTILLTLLVVFVLALTIFSTNGSKTSASAEGTGTYLSSSYSGSSANAQTTSSGNSNVTGSSDDYFSERDLSGAYDDDVFNITLTGSGAESDSGNVLVSGSAVTITASGTYVITGTLNNGTIMMKEYNLRLE